MGMLVHDIMCCSPHETAELQCLVGFIVYNIPGARGFQPRDIDRPRSLATPLERDLQMFQVNEFDSITEYIRDLFKNYREVRMRVLSWLGLAAEKRAALASQPFPP